MIRRGIILLAMTSVGLQATPAGSADGPAAEQASRLGLPYRCSVVQGAVVVEPGPEYILDITGPREQRLFTTCDPPFSNNCRSLTVHKFDVICGLDRVGWHRVVAAIGRTAAGDAALSKGHLVLTREADRASGNAPSCRDRASADVAGGECLPWNIRKPTERLVLPQGFAPVHETGARFIDDAAPRPAFAAAEIGAMGVGMSSSAPYLMTPDTETDEAFGSVDHAGARAIATNISTSNETEGWTTSLSFNKTEETAPELIVATSSVSGHAAVSAAADSGPSALPWIAALLATLGLAAAVARYGMPRMRLTVPDLSGAADAALRNFRKVQSQAQGVVANVRDRLAETNESAPVEHTPPGDPALSSALLQLRAMHARTEAAVATLSSATVVREVMQTELAAIRARIESAERAAARGSTPVMKLAAQFRQIARDIDRVQDITESAAQSTSGQPGR